MPDPTPTTSGTNEAPVTVTLEKVAEIAMRKDGIKTTEFWLSLAAILVGGLAGSGIFNEGTVWYNITGLAVVALTILGYTASRTQLKLKK